MAALLDRRREDAGVLPDSPPLELTILMPCLNEAETLEVCVRKACGYLERTGIAGEVLVADDDGAVAGCTPCGACRQALVQFGRGARVFHRNDGAFRCDTAEALLPFSFRFSPKPR